MWKEVIGPLVRRGGKVLLTRMGLLVCIDGFPAFNLKRKGAISLCPSELINLSLPPDLRYDPDNIMIWLLIPNEMSATSQLKYFKYVTINELNPLQTEGVPGPDGHVKIKLFGATLDLKGKEKFYNTSSVGSYCGCTTCEVHYERGPDGPIKALARRYLPADHPLRSRQAVFKGLRFEYHKTEVESPPRLKTTQTLFNYVAAAKRLGVEHYLGQKGDMMLAYYRGIQYDKFNILEWMHNLARAYDNFADLLLGGNTNFDKRARATSKALGVFPSLSAPVYLSQVTTPAFL